VLQNVCMLLLSDVLYNNSFNLSNEFEIFSGVYVVKMLEMLAFWVKP
jgi:hypothetical protein